MTHEYDAEPRLVAIRNVEDTPRWWLCPVHGEPTYSHLQPRCQTCRVLMIKRDK